MNQRVIHKWKNYDIIVGTEKNYTKKHLFRKIEVFSKVEKKQKYLRKWQWIQFQMFYEKGIHSMVQMVPWIDPMILICIILYKKSERNLLLLLFLLLLLMFVCCNIIFI